MIFAPMMTQLIQANDARVTHWLPRQQADGGLRDQYALPSAQETARFIAALGSAGRAEGSRYFQSTELVVPLERAMAWLLAAQHDDGTIDLLSTNFHSPPDTAFMVEVLGPLAAILRDRPWSPLDNFRTRLGDFLRRAGEALISGGVHTPNHRWVVCAGLARVHDLYPDDRYLARIEQWLAEGIDCDLDGQYTEKSTGGYSAVVDRALLIVARLLDRPELYDPVRRNLAMTLYYVHPDGELVTEPSRRQDQYQRVGLARYHLAYRTLALRDGDGRFAAVVRQLEAVAPTEEVNDFASWLEQPELSRALPPDEALPTDYARVFTHSSLARVRRGPLSATTLAENTTLFSLRCGGAALEAVRLASAFFGRGQFVADSLAATPGGYRLRQQLAGTYFQPLRADQITPGEPVLMAPNGTLATDDRARRDTSNEQSLTTVVEVREVPGGFALDFHVEGTAGVPVAIELGFRAGGELEGVTPVEGVADAFLLREGTGRYRTGNDVITFGPGQADHTWTQLRGARPKWEGDSVYLTGLTPWYPTITFTGESTT